MSKSFIIAIDGPNGSGKGTLARNLGQQLGWPVLDTGLLYRAVGWMVLQKGESLEDENAALHCADELHEHLDEILANPELRSLQSSNAASIVSSYPSVRQSLFDLQRNFALHPPGGAGGAVIDGRDIGTVICPDADVKIFITAQPEIRAERRARDEYGEKWQPHFAAVLEKTIDRDRRDSERAIAPMKPAIDAIILDSSGNTQEEILKAALAIIQKKR